MCRSASTAPSESTTAASSLAHRHRAWSYDFFWGGKDEVDEDDLRMSWIKVRKSCAWSSASLSRPGPSRSRGKTKSRRLEMRRDAVDGQHRPRCLNVPCLRSTALCCIRLSAG